MEAAAFLQRNFDIVNDSTITMPKYQRLADWQSMFEMEEQ
jgi:hypothetical protein